MRYYVLSATCTGIWAKHHRKLALVAYDGTLNEKQLKINPRFKGLSIIKCHPHLNVNGKDNAFNREYESLMRECAMLNAGLIKV